jgi:hypothetical protein
MRKTQLWSKLEKTPEYYDPKITYDGRKIVKIEAKRNSTMGKAKRFVEYEKDARRLGFEIGPGSYRQDYGSIYENRTRGTPVYKKFYRQRDLNDNWYFYINDSYMRSTHMRKTF